MQIVNSNISWYRLPSNLYQVAIKHAPAALLMTMRRRMVKRRRRMLMMTLRTITARPQEPS